MLRTVNTAGSERFQHLHAEITGELQGIRDTIAQSNESTNRRIDDLAESVKQQTASVNQRLNDHQQDTDKRFAHVERRIDGVEKSVENTNQMVAANNKKVLVSSGGSSALVIGLIEVIKALAK